MKKSSKWLAVGIVSTAVITAFAAQSMSVGWHQARDSSTYGYNSRDARLLGHEGGFVDRARANTPLGASRTAPPALGAKRDLAAGGESSTAAPTRQSPAGAADHAEGTLSAQVLWGD